MRDFSLGGGSKYDRYAQDDKMKDLKRSCEIAVLEIFGEMATGKIIYNG